MRWAKFRVTVTAFVGLTILAVLEQATNGWGVGGQMFTAIYFGGADAPLWQRTVTYFIGMLFFFFIGAVFASVYVRWKAPGLTVSLIGFGAILLGLVALFTVTRTWDAVGAFFATAGPFGIVLWLLVPTAIAGVVGYLVLRRATPR